MPLGNETGEARKLRIVRGGGVVEDIPYLLELSASQEAEIARLQHRVGLETRAYERLELCPDHRDKTNGTCIVCMAEKRTKGELEAELSAVRQTLQELDEMADRYATSHGGYCGNTKGVLLSLLHPSRNSNEG